MTRFQLHSVLSPIMVFLGWVWAREAAETKSLFIPVNSVSGLLSNTTNTRDIPLFALPSF